MSVLPLLAASIHCSAATQACLQHFFLGREQQKLWAGNTTVGEAVRKTVVGIWTQSATVQILLNAHTLQLETPFTCSSAKIEKVTVSFTK